MKVSTNVVASFSGFFLSCVLGMSDFDNVRKNYEFIFHDTHDLLLAIKDNNCYFFSAPDSVDFALLPLFRAGGEDIAIAIIERNDPHLVKSSSLDVMREKYSDLLVDYHCMDKIIFDVTYDQNYHHQQQQQQQSQPTSPTPNSGDPDEDSIDYLLG